MQQPMKAVRSGNDRDGSNETSLNFVRTSRRRTLPMAGLVLIAFWHAAPGMAFSRIQETATVATQVEDDAAPDAPEKVDVKPVSRDSDISQRLTDILKSSKRFRSPEVVVENGVAFLSGEALEPEFKAWAGDLAVRTQDVAAVVNRMSVTEKSIWDFSEAFVELREFRANTIQAIPLIIFGAVVLLITWLLASLARYVTARMLNERVPNPLLRWVLAHSIMLPVLIFGIYIVLRISGLTQLALTVLGGTGLIGLVIGIAFQNIAENFLASILISIQKPFRAGDLVEIDAYEGIVQRVTTRGTTLMTLDGNLVQIPNSKVYKATIVNFSANPSRRVSFDIGVGYDDLLSEAQSIVMEKIRQHKSTLRDPAPRVLIESLTAATVNLRVSFWIDGSKNDWRSVRSSLMRICKQALQKRGISLPDESREVIFPNGVPVIMTGIGSEGYQPDESRNPVPTDSGTVDSFRQGAPTAESRQRLRMQPDEEPVSEAEGGLRSEEVDVKRQARNSWLPGKGSEILISDDGVHSVDDN